VPAEAAAVLTQAQVSRIQGFPPSWDWSPVSDKRSVDQMIANAVPAALAEAIGRVILTREAGESIPAIEGRFGQWLLRSKGFSKPAVRNAKSRLNRVRRLLGGRTFADAGAEMATLEGTEAFAALPTATRSDLRKAVRLYRDWERDVEARRARRRDRSVKPVESEAVAA
jgi:DNA (cytosine-5)-methyltransferase 1